MFDNAPLLELPELLPELPPEPPEPPLPPKLPEPPEPPHRPERPERPEPLHPRRPTINLPLGTGNRALINNLMSRSGLFESDREYEREPLVIALGHLWRVFRAIDLALVEADQIDVSGTFEEGIYQMADDPTCTAAKLGDYVLYVEDSSRRIPTDQTDYVAYELYREISHGCDLLIHQMAGADQRSGHLVRAIGYIRLAEQALSLDRFDRHDIDPADNPRAFAELVGEADLEVCRRAAVTLGDQLIQQAAQQKDVRRAGGEGQWPDREEPT